MRTFSLTLYFRFSESNSKHSQDARAVTHARAGSETHRQRLLMQTRRGGGCMGRADLLSCSLRILHSPISLILKSEIRQLPAGAQRTRCQVEQCSGSTAPVASPHGGSVGVGEGGMQTPSLDSPISNYLKASLIVHTAHAPSHAPSPALALMVGRTCIFSSCRPEAVGRWMGLTDLNLTI